MKLWLVKDRKKRIFGPYNEKEICFYIEEGEFKGTEFFCSYPVGKWKPLSSNPLFYEKVIQQLNKKSRKGGEKSSSQKSHSAKDSETDLSSFQIDDEESSSHTSSTSHQEEKVIEATRIVAPRKDPVKVVSKRKKVKIRLSEKFKEQVLEEEAGASEIIDMENLPKSWTDKLKITLKLPVLIFLIVGGLVGWFFIPNNRSMNLPERIQLSPVTKQYREMGAKELKKTLQEGAKALFRGGVLNHLMAEKHYISVLESQPENPSIYHSLCLIYLELWPFAWQNVRDRGAFQQLINLVKIKDKQRIYTDFCKSAFLLAEKKPEQALSKINRALNETSTTKQVFFYYVKALALKALDKSSSAISYLQEIYKHQPEWTSPYLLHAEILYERGQYSEVGNIYKKVLSVQPKHLEASLQLGLLEYRRFKQRKQGEQRLKKAISKAHHLANPEILFSAYSTLAEIYWKRQDIEQAKIFIRRAFSLYPEDPFSLKAKKTLKVNGELEKIPLKTSGLIYRGERESAKRGCAKGEPYFTRAYKVGSQGSALPALQIAKCQWERGFSGQAVRWLKKAVNVSVRQIDGYFLLADYLSALYDFETAGEMLKIAKRRGGASYDLFKAYALVSFREKNYEAAKAYAERALNFYNSSAELYTLLSNICRFLDEKYKSFSYAEKALMEDESDPLAQIAHARAMGLVYGNQKTEAAFKQLMESFPSEMKYIQAFGEYYFENERYEQALVLLESLLERDPKHKQAHIYLGRIYSLIAYRGTGDPMEKYEKAVQHFLSASLLDISDPIPVFWSARTHLQHEQYYKSEQEFEKILNINPNYPLIHYYIGLANFYQQREESLEKALKSVEIQKVKTPKNILPYKLAGDIYRVRSKGAFSYPQEKQVVYELCIKEYQKALSYMKEDLEISISLMECYKGAGDNDSALQLALQLTKDKERLTGRPEIYREIGLIFESMDQYEKARSYYNSYFLLNPRAEDRRDIEARINKLIGEKQSLSKPKKQK